MTKSHDVNVDNDYGTWLSGLKTSYQQAQVKAAIKVNSEKLLWNWQLGRDLVMRKAEEKWGTGIVEQLSLDLQAAFPGEKGFGARNIWAMKQWYLFYAEKLHQLGGEIEKVQQPVEGLNPKLQQTIAELLSAGNHDSIKLHQLGKEIHEEVVDGVPFPEIFAFVPWGHHVEIITKCKTLEEALFYIYRTIDEGLSRAALTRMIQADLYHTQGGAITNFTEYLPQVQAELAQEMTKENYDFGFLALPAKYTEKHLEDALCQQMTRFLLELGSGWAFVGRQKEVVVGGNSRRIDLLFYHINLRCYVVVELKAVAFQPEFAGKLNYYVSAVDELVKSEHDNPTIGLLICSNMQETDVQWAFRGVTTPIGVAAYSNVQIEQIKKQLPTVEQLQARIKLLEQELRGEIEG